MTDDGGAAPQRRAGAARVVVWRNPELTLSGARADGETRNIMKILNQLNN